MDSTWIDDIKPETPTVVRDDVTNTFFDADVASPLVTYNPDDSEAQPLIPADSESPEVTSRASDVTSSEEGFSKFRNLLLRDSINIALPYTLLETSNPDPEVVTSQEKQLFELFETMNQSGLLPELKDLYNVYEGESSRLESDRKMALESPLYVDTPLAVNQYYDSERLSVISRVWQSVDLYQQCTKDTTRIQSSTLDTTTSSDSSTTSDITPTSPVSMDTSSTSTGSPNNALNVSADSGFNDSHAEEKPLPDSTTVQLKCEPGEPIMDWSYKSRYLPHDGLSLLKAWYAEHFEHPYPSMQEAQDLAKQGNMTVAQVKKWFANKRVRSFNTTSFNATKTKKRPYERLDERAQRILNSWLVENMNKPYPTTDEKRLLAQRCGISVSQVGSWFSNKRSKARIPKYVRKHLEKHPEDAASLLNESNQLAKRRPFADITNTAWSSSSSQSPAPNRHVTPYSSQSSDDLRHLGQSPAPVQMSFSPESISHVQYNTIVNYQLPMYPQFPPIVPDFYPVSFPGFAYSPVQSPTFPQEFSFH